MNDFQLRVSPSFRVRFDTAFPGGFPGGSDGKESICDAGDPVVVKNMPPSAGDIRDTGSVLGSGRSPRGEHGNPLQYSCLENAMDRGAWQASPWGRKDSDTTD